jgi:hypothetical protein
MLELDSTYFCESIGEKFAKNGRVELKIWLKQVLNQIWKF